MLWKGVVAAASLFFFLLCINAQEKPKDNNNQSNSNNGSSVKSLADDLSNCTCKSYTEVCCPDICVNYYLCINGSVNSDGTGLLDIRSLSPPPETLGPFDKFYTFSNGTFEEPKIYSLNDNRTRCGYRNPEGIGFKLTSTDNTAEYGEFPWMVALLHERKIEGDSTPVNVYQCGGALIHPQVVVTTAFCVQSDSQFKVRAGEWNSQNANELYPLQEKKVESVIIHPQYKSGSLHNDIALVFLKKPFQITESVNVVCLPPQGIVVDNGRCFASGWGIRKFGERDDYSKVLKKIDIPIVPRDSCQAAMRKTRLEEVFVLHESFICAGGEPGKDTCTGDGGSPLVCPIKGGEERYQQVGIVSWGIKCGEKDVPGVYVNLALFRNWIDQQMDLKNFEKSTYQH